MKIEKKNLRDGINENAKLTIIGIILNVNLELGVRGELASFQQVIAINIHYHNRVRHICTLTT